MASSFFLNRVVTLGRVERRGVEGNGAGSGPSGPKTEDGTSAGVGCISGNEYAVVTGALVVNSSETCTRSNERLNSEEGLFTLGQPGRK